jgi:hypothetical protein
MPVMTPFGPGCPWYDDLLRFGPANVKWCEPRICAWINEPLNTWSNLGYLAAGVWIWAKAGPSKAGKGFGAAVFVMGSFSFLYHATNNFLTQALDFFGMYLMVYFVLGANLRRLGMPRAAMAPFYAGACVLSTLALWPIARAGIPIQFTVAALAVLMVVSEFAARAKTGDSRPLGTFWAGVATITAAELCSLADMKRVVCDPSLPWLQGHAAWHLIAAVAMVFIYRHWAPDFDRAWA